MAADTTTTPCPAPRPRRWFVLVVALVLLAEGGPARALPTREIAPIHRSHVFSFSLKDQTLSSLEHQETSPRVPKTRIRDFVERLTSASGSAGRLKEEWIRVSGLGGSGNASGRGFGMDTPIEHGRPDGGGRETLLTDLLQTALAGRDDAGSEIRTVEHNAYGTLRSGTDTGPVGFHGARKLGSTGLLYLRNRIYDPSLGRFLSRDPAGFMGGRNKYAYANGMPNIGRDPEGLRFTRKAKATLAPYVPLLQGTVGMDIYNSIESKPRFVDVSFSDSVVYKLADYMTPQEVTEIKADELLFEDDDFGNKTVLGTTNCPPEKKTKNVKVTVYLGSLNIFGDMGSSSLPQITTDPGQLTAAVRARRLTWFAQKRGRRDLAIAGELVHELRHALMGLEGRVFTSDREAEEDAYSHQVQFYYEHKFFE